MKEQVYSKDDLIRDVVPESYQSKYGRHDRYMEIYCSLDSETVMITDGKDHYTSQVFFSICVEDKGMIFPNHNFKELFETLDYLIDNLTYNGILAIYVHNLGFDSSFWLYELLKEREGGRWLSNVFITPSRVVISFRYKGKIEFRNSLALTGLSLDDSVIEYIGKDSEYRKTKDWDYNKLRCANTDLNKEEQEYALIDAYAVVEIIKTIARMNGKYVDGKLIQPLSIADMPSTRTSFVKRDMYKFLYKNLRSESKMRKSDVARMRIMLDRAKAIMFPATKEGLHNLEMVHDSYIGGLSDNNPYYTNCYVENPGSWDQTSQYPKQLVTNPFPSSAMVNCQEKDINKILKMCDFQSKEDEIRGIRKGAILKVTFKNFRCKNTPIPLFAIDKRCDVDKDIMTSGKRVIHGKYITRTLCDVDLVNFVNTYDYEECIVHECKMFDMSPVPELIARYVLNSYSQKTMYKNDDEHKITYELRKIATNSITGIISEYPLYDSIDLDENGLAVKTILTDEEKIEILEKYNKNMEKVGMCLYMWAPYITAYSRKDLYSVMIDIGEDAIFCDTDSVKFENRDKYDHIFLEWNKINEKRLKMCGWNWFGFTEQQISELMMPCDIHGEIHPIGNWENETFNKRGRLVGVISKRAKCYMLVYEKDNVKDYKFVIAGIQGDNVAKYARHCIQENLFNIKDEIEFFEQEEILIPKEFSGKLRVERFFNQPVYKYTDYQGHKAIMLNRTGTHLIPQEFTIKSKDIDDKSLLDYIFGINEMDVFLGNFG